MAALRIIEKDLARNGYAITASLLFYLLPGLGFRFTSAHWSMNDASSELPPEAVGFSAGSAAGSFASFGASLGLGLAAALGFGGGAIICGGGKKTVVGGGGGTKPAFG
jgi:hypothetical protein